MRQTAAWPLLVLAALAACDRGGGTGPAAQPSQVEAARLEAADAADGVKDHVVAKCAVCGLGMDGTAEHVSRYGGYELRFCSRECRETFDHDPHAVIGRLHPPAR
jgi:YHS domain-containing protein